MLTVKMQNNLEKQNKPFVFVGYAAQSSLAAGKGEVHV
jgi:hypothetical protein